jgi:2'-5' RNA ligase
MSAFENGKTCNPKAGEPTHLQVGNFSKVHHVTVCMVPPPEDNAYLWEILSAMRRQMKDPGYFRWPPHVNLLYPFLKLQRPREDGEISGDDSTMSLQEILLRLEAATQKVPAFPVRLHTFGTFGGKQRGVLWLHPYSTVVAENNESDDSRQSSKLDPLIKLQKHMKEAFPMCNDQSKTGTFVPHMTISHFPNLDDALEAQKDLEASFPNRDDLEFLLDRVYLLERKGDGGQFLKVAEIPLGEPSNDRTVDTRSFDPPEPFLGMPSTEEDWVHTARMDMKRRRNKNQRRRHNKSPATEQTSPATSEPPKL